jgi:hypothetical protein
MCNISACIAFDVDRPRGTWLSRESGTELLNQKLAFAGRVNRFLESKNAKRTLFLCGTFLEEAYNKVGKSELHQALLPSKNVELGHHTYSHGIFQQIPSRTVTDHFIYPSQIAEELDKTQKIIEGIFDQNEVQYFLRGLRTPLGYSQSVLDNPEIAKALLGKISFISSRLRGDLFQLKAPSFQDEDRRPYMHPSGILEIPSHGWQDSAYTGSQTTKIHDIPPIGIKAIKEFYFQEFNALRSFVDAKKYQTYTYVFCWHYFDMMTYDPDLEVLSYILEELFPKLNISTTLYSDIR